ncbi:Protein-lysine N-methyltransferase efm4 [Emydomyces testavorans]|uniref:Protein-lysine N-methyltransferase EFM4 n=1 Tax=Emydomyces testavorans TaxID=2070801 RepID=A0AAF0IL73_9EURO|nr:Protein-lysine N-methyltransferase efm4 [Emydomyces testavorans]
MSSVDLERSDGHPQHLDPNLGVFLKSSWETYYERSLECLSSKKDAGKGVRHSSGGDEHDYGDDNVQEDDDDEDDDDDDDPGTSWFAEHKAPEKVLQFLTSEGFPLAPCNIAATATTSGADDGGGGEQPCILDLGTGNGSMLRLLRSGGFAGEMVGVDYSERSVELARRLGVDGGKGRGGEIRFEVWDILAAGERGSGGDDDGISALEWFPVRKGGFDIVLDKGTFDAVSLSGEQVVEEEEEGGDGDGDAAGRKRVVRRVCEMYPGIARRLVKRGGFLVVTSCNWTEEELVKWFAHVAGEDGGDGLEVWGRIEYPNFRFGGVEGQGVCTVCFRRKRE